MIASEAKKHLKELQRNCMKEHVKKGMSKANAKKKCEYPFHTNNGHIIRPMSNKNIEKAKAEYKKTRKPTYQEKLKIVCDQHYKEKGLTKAQRRPLCTQRKIKDVMFLATKLRTVH